MKKIIKALLLIEGLLIAATIVILLAIIGRDDFSFLLAAIPATGAIVLGVVIMGWFFISSVRSSVKGPPTKNIIGLVGAIIPLIALPAFGIYYSSIGDNRENLALVCKAGVVIGAFLSILLIAKFVGNER